MPSLDTRIRGVGLNLSTKVTPAPSLGYELRKGALSYSPEYLSLGSGQFFASTYWDSRERQTMDAYGGRIVHLIARDTHTPPLLTTMCRYEPFLPHYAVDSQVNAVFAPRC